MKGRNENQLNIQKYGISFEEAASVFLDDESLILSDDEHSEDEERFILIGFSFKANLLVVCHCYRSSETVVRIISARKADSSERKEYLNQNEKPL